MNKETIIKRLSALAISGTILATPSLYAQNDTSPPEDYPTPQAETLPDASASPSERELQTQQKSDPVLSVDEPTAQEMQEKAQQPAQTNEFALSEVLGAPVQDMDGKRLGAIEDLAIDVSSVEGETFAVVRSDNRFDNRRALIPLSELSEAQGQQNETTSQSEQSSTPTSDLGLMSQSADASESQDTARFSVELSAEELDQLPHVEIRQDEIVTSIQDNVESINQSFDSNIEIDQSADYRLATDLREATVQGNEHGQTELEQTLVNLENGDLSFILADSQGSQFRVPATEVAISAENQIEMTESRDLSNFQIYADTAARNYRLEEPTTEESAQQSEDQFATSEPQPNNQSMGEDDSSSVSIDNEADQDDFAVSSGAQTSSAQDAEGANDADQGQVYSSNGLASEDESSRNPARDEAGDTEVATSDSSEQADDEWISAKQQWDGSGALRNLTDPSVLLGVTVKDSAGESVGEIKDALIRQDNGEIAYLVVETDNWFDSSAALIPVSSAQADMSEPLTDQSQEGMINEQAARDDQEAAPTAPSSASQAPTTVNLQISEDEFEELADYDDSSEIETYLSENRSRIAGALGVNETELPDQSVALTRVSDAHRDL